MIYLSVRGQYIDKNSDYCRSYLEFVGGGGGGRGGGAFFDVSPLICTLSGESYSFSLIIMLYYFILGLGGRGGVAVFVVFPSCILLGLLVPVGFGGTASNLSFVS